MIVFLASCADIALATVLVINAESSFREREIWPSKRPDLEGLFDILFGKGGKVSIEEVGEGGEECVSMIKTDGVGTMSKY